MAQVSPSCVTRMRTETLVYPTVVFIDAGVPDRGAIIAAVDPSWQVRVLDRVQDGLGQMAEELARIGTVQALHLVCHGAPGQLRLGSDRVLCTELRAEQAKTLADIGHHLAPEGEIFLYACDFAAGAVGRDALRQVAITTGARVAAASAPIGAARLGGSWELDQTTAPILGEALRVPAFEGLLADFLRLGTDASENFSIAVTGTWETRMFGGDDTVLGNFLADLIYGGIGNDSLNGASGSDTIYGDSGNDTLLGYGDPDTLYGGSGDDVLMGMAGGDLLDGGDGTDLVSYRRDSFGPLNINLATGTATGGDATGDVLISIENVLGSFSDDTLIGNSLANFLDGAEGNDQIDGGEGNDTIDGGFGADTLNGGPGTGDWLIYDFTNMNPVNVNLGTGVTLGVNEGDVLSGFENVRGTVGKDTLVGSAGNNIIDGGAGNDIISGGNRFDTLRGGFGADSLDGGSEGDWAFYDTSFAGVNVNLSGAVCSGGEAAGDVLTGIEFLLGSAFDDTLTGASPGGDLLYGANDRLMGAGGNDILDGKGGSDTLDGGSGTDWARYDGSEAGVTVNLSLSTAQISIGDADGDVLSSIENLAGSALQDTLIGSSGANQLDGGAERDIIDGGAGNDLLKGGLGNDTLTGGLGADQLQGDDGSDYAAYENSDLGVTVDLALLTAQVSAGHASGDVLQSIENLQGSALDDTLYGDDSGNFLLGGIGNDLIVGRNGADGLAGDVGDDTLVGGEGADYFDGGDGIDWVRYDLSLAGVTVDLRLVEELQTSAGDAANDALMGVENILGSSLGDTLTGDAVANLLNGGAANDILSGDDGEDTLQGDIGDDTLQGGAGADSLDGGTGTDLVSYSDATLGVTVDLGREGVQISAGDADGDLLSGIENALGSALADWIIGSAAGNAIDGAAGGDRLDGGNGDDSLSGGEGEDTLQGGLGADTLLGGTEADWASYETSSFGVTVRLSLTTAQVSVGDAAGDVLGGIENLIGSALRDRLTGGTDANVLDGRDGADWLDGGAQNDSLFGGNLNDTLRGGSGADLLSGGTGVNLAIYDTSTQGVTVSLALTTAQVSAGDAAGDVLIDVSNLLGSNLNDRLTGSIKANNLQGGAGNDVLFGGLGIDTLMGGSGADRLVGGTGRDALYGGLDTLTDVFVFTRTTESVVGSLRDAIHDFDKGTDDVDLSLIDANIGVAGDQAFTWAGTTATGFGAWYVLSGVDLILRVDVNGDLTADMEVMLLGHNSIEANDLVL